MAQNDYTGFERRASDSTADTEAYNIEENEGGASAWLTVAGSFLVYYSSFGVINSFGFFQNYYQHDFLDSTAPPTIAIIGTLQLYLMNTIAPVSGALCDTFGFKYLYIASGIGTSCALLILSSINSAAFWNVFLTQGVLMGFTIAFGVQPAITAAAQHFKTRRALPMGIVATGCALGGVCFPIMFSCLVPMIGFAWTLRVAALKTASCYAIALWISTSKHTHRKIRCRTLLDFKGFLDVRYSVLCLGAFIAQFGIWIPNYYIESYCSIISPTTVLRGYFLPLINGTSIFGMILGGLLGDTIGPLNLLYPITFSLGLLCIVWLLASCTLILLFFACLFGLCSGAFVALLPPIVSQISPHDMLGARIGAFFSVIAISCLVGSPIGGAMIWEQTRTGYRPVILYAGGTLILGSLVMLGSRLLHDRNLRVRW